MGPWKLNYVDIMAGLFVLLVFTRWKHCSSHRAAVALICAFFTFNFAGWKTDALCPSFIGFFSAVAYIL